MSLEIETKTEQTVAGEVEYESVPCEHCGYDTALEKARVAVFPRNCYKKTGYDVSDRYIKVEYASDADQYAFCPECAESLFGSVRGPNYLRKLDLFMQDRESKLILMGVIHGLLIVFGAIGLLVVLGSVV